MKQETIELLRLAADWEERGGEVSIDMADQGRTIATFFVADLPARGEMRRRVGGWDRRSYLDEDVMDRGGWNYGPGTVADLRAHLDGVLPLVQMEVTP